MDLTKLIHLKPEEEVMMVVHGSLIPLWSKMLLTFFWLVLPFFLLFPLFHLHLFGVVLFILLLMSGWLYAYRAFVVWHRSVLVVTDRRLIDMDRRGLWSQVVSEVVYPEVKDVSFAIKGFWPAIFHYGTLTVKVTQSSIALQVFHVRHPRQVHDLINDLRHVESN